MRWRFCAWPNGRFAQCLLVALLAAQSFLLSPIDTAAASSVSVSAWICPDGLSTQSLDKAGLLAACSEASVGTTFALSTGGLTRRRVTAADKPAVWPAVAGDFQISIDDPGGEPAMVACNQNGAATLFDAQAGQISGALADGDTLICDWFRLSGVAAEPVTTQEPTAAPTETIATVEPTPAQVASESATTPESSGDPASGDYSGLIDVGGHGLFLICAGNGTITVILESGGPGGASDRWNTIVPNISADFRVCRYDRAGLGQSDPPFEGTRTIQDSVNDLRALIISAPLACPCVFVGESWGANIVRLYAGQYPVSIAGMVLIDPIAPGFLDDFVSIVSSEAPGYSTLMGSDNPESMDQMASLRQADTATIPPPVPTIVLAHGLNLGFPISYPVDKLEKSWRDRQEALAVDLHALHIVARLSSNSIVKDEPQVVLDAINAVLTAVANPAGALSAAVVHRIGSEDEPLTGSCFQIYLDAGGGERGDYRGGACDADIDGDENGVIILTSLEPGDYVLQEIDPPAGIEAAPDQELTVIGTASHITIKTLAIVPENESIVIQMDELNGSGMSGTATLTAKGRTTEVLVEITGATGNHPIHVHYGTCDQLGEVAYPLTNIGADGRSLTIIDISVEDLLTGGFAINAHQSEEDIVSYVACGEVKP